MNHVQLFSTVLDHEPFPLPQAGLFADLDLGMGVVSLSNEFRALPGLKQLSILDDWKKGLDKERRLAIAALFREATRGMGNVDLPKKIARFKQVCTEIGVECPADLPLLLQQV